MSDSVKQILSEKRVNAIVREIQTVIAFLKDSAVNDSSRSFEPLISGVTRKKMVYIDKAAEMLLAGKLKNIFNDHYDVMVYGEESLELLPIIKNGNIGRFLKRPVKKEKLVFLLDAVDGTDLYLKNLGNWCTAVLLYMDKKKRVLGSFIGLPSGTVYFSTDDIPGVAKKPLIKKIAAVSKRRAVSSRLNLNNITLSWYGQKAENFLSLARHKRFLAFLQNQKKNSNFRMLNIGGIPLMIRMIDNIVPVDVIIELFGQQPHDMIAGAYLAKKAGAVLTDLKGNDIDFTHYLGDLKGEKLKYILATSKGYTNKALKIFK